MSDKTQLIRKIKALAEHGESGESENAAVLLRDLMKKYNVTEAELQEDRQIHYRPKTHEPVKPKSNDVDFFNEIIYPSTTTKSKVENNDFFHDVIAEMAAAKRDRRSYGGSKNSLDVTAPKLAREWQAQVDSRSHENSHPCCSRHKIVAGFNDLATKNPTLAAQWHPTKNEDLKPSDIGPYSDKSVWWLCPNCGHEWKTPVYNRSRRIGCPHCCKVKGKRSF